MSRKPRRKPELYAADLPLPPPIPRPSAEAPDLDILDLLHLPSKLQRRSQPVHETGAGLMTSRWAPGGVPEHREEVIIKKEEDDEGFGLGNVVGGSAGVQFDGSGSDRPKNGARRRRRAENEDQSVEVPDSVKEYLNATKDSAQEVVTRMTLLEKIVEKTGERVKVLEGENRELKARLEGSVVMSEMERAELEELRAFKRSVLGAAEIR